MCFAICTEGSAHVPKGAFPKPSGSDASRRFSIWLLPWKYCLLTTLVFASARSQGTQENTTCQEVRLTPERMTGGRVTVGNGGDLTSQNGICSIFNFLPWAWRAPCFIFSFTEESVFSQFTFSSLSGSSLWGALLVVLTFYLSLWWLFWVYNSLNIPRAPGGLIWQWGARDNS